MTGEREFQAAAEHRPMQRGHDGLGSGLHGREHVAEHGRARFLIEFADVRSGHEMGRGAADDDGADVGGSVGRQHRIEECLAHGLCQRIDRRIVDAEHGDLAMTLNGDHARSMTMAIP